jgi:hypothetical protein
MSHPLDRETAYLEQHHRDSAELRRICGARDQARSERNDLRRWNAELLAVLKDLVDRCEFDGIPSDSALVVDAARAAIASAEGDK